MAKKTSHVIVRDGSAALGQPFRPQPAPPPSKSHEAPPAPKAFAASYSNDQGIVGRFPVDPKTFSEIGGTPSPRQRLARGEKVVDNPTTPRDLPPAPLG